MFTANSLEKIPAAGKLNTDTKIEISKAPQAMWNDICHAAEEQRWTREETRERIKRIKSEPERVQEILQPPLEVLEAPSDKLIPLTKKISKQCESLDQLCDDLDPSLYDWGSGFLALHVLHGLYVLAEKITFLAEKTRMMIEFLESRKC